MHIFDDEEATVAPKDEPPHETAQADGYEDATPGLPLPVQVEAHTKKARVPKKPVQREAGFEPVAVLRPRPKRGRAKRQPAMAQPSQADSDETSESRVRRRRHMKHELSVGNDESARQQ